LLCFYFRRKSLHFNEKMQDESEGKRLQNVFTEFLASSPTDATETAQLNAYDISAMWPQMMKRESASSQPCSASSGPDWIAPPRTLTPSSPNSGFINVQIPPPPQSNRSMSMASTTTLATPGPEWQPPEPSLTKVDPPGNLSPITKPYFPKKPESPINTRGTYVLEDSLSQPLFPEITYITDAGGNMIAVEDYVWNRFLKGNVYKHGSIELGHCQGIMTDQQAHELAKMAASQLFEANVAEPGSLPAPLLRSSYPSVIGGNLFNHISDLKVQSFFRHLLLQIVTGQQKRYTYHWYCDSPDLERKMSMTVNRLAQGAEDKFVLWSSKILHETPLACKAPYLDAPASPDSPHTVCSFCKRLLVTRKDISPQALGLVDSWVKNNWTENSQPLVDHASGVPGLGARGKAGQHWEESKNVNHVWMTPAQYYGLGKQVPDVSKVPINHGCCSLCYRECATAFFPQFLMSKHG